MHERRDPHQSTSRISDIILGGQDGLVNVLGVLLGVAAATSDAHIVVVAGLATAFAESISMAAVAYTSTQADADLYESERARELRHIKAIPALEREEVREMFARRGFEGEMLGRIVAAITADKDVWVAVMLAEEHKLVPIDRAQALRSAFTVGVSALIGSLLPVLPFFAIPVRESMFAATLLAAVTLFIAGVYKARVTVGKPWKSGAELAIIGTVSAMVGYAVGAIFNATGFT